jgi:hypothetical protein
MLPALCGTNPLGFLAALGVLEALSGVEPDATLRWTDELIPQAVVGGIGELDVLLDVLESDRQRWKNSVVLRFPEGDVKPDRTTLRDWYVTLVDKGDPYSDGNLLCALVAEDAFDNNKKAKPTHLHFTAGQQRFLDMVRELVSSVDRDRMEEAIRGPWRYDSKLPSMSWDSRGERIYAVRGTNPSNEKRLGVPGADWLAFRGLVFYPVTRTDAGSLRTTACDAEWKRSAFRWPLWSPPCTRAVAASLVADSSLIGGRAAPKPSDLEERGILSILQAPIRRTDQGGYGSFGAPETIASATRGHV